MASRRRSSLVCTGILILTLAAPTTAQDIQVTDFEWWHPHDAPDQLPTLPGRLAKSAEVPPALRQSNLPHYMEQHVVLAADGRVLSSKTHSTSPWLDYGVLLGETGSFGSARRGGRPAMAEIRRFAIFNPASAAPQGRDLTPRLNQVTAATWPADAPEDIPVPVIMMVEVSVDDTGRVTHARAVTEGLPPAFAQIAQTTVTRWTFAPALQEGRPVAAALRVPVLFVGPSGTRIDTLTTPPKVIQRKRPEYPDSMIRTNRQGNVVVGFEVTPEGKTANVHVVRSSHPAFDEPALDAVEQWVFEPGVVNGVPVRTRMAVPIVFSIVDGQSPWKVTRNRRDLAKLPPAFQWDSPPEIENYWPPVYPRHALMNGIRGDVLIGFVVAPDGRVIRAESMREADPTLIAATLAAVETYVFKPATKQGKPCYAALNMEFTFHDRRYSSATISPSASRVIKQLRSSPESLVPVSALDNLPRPRSQRPPVIPVVALQQGRSGRALVEFVVDRRGSVVLPHVLEASSPEFGYAAVQAVSAWRYEIPRRDGRLVDAVLRVPFEFNVREPGSPSDG